ncbi:putative transcription factor Trihelix family [Helianthus annuus]|uniref:Putative sequence-specific DNA binding transcription factor n=1 Tax=Helianthus annuus TaxID=4232 RepID=A0A251V004_HELAN|nr:trihelix transcription factor ASIL2 [Helianthus annuus]KAF5810662.1 putative transcription factor Trihelix family [Helianthus annuus]KAJ0581455.1 putative transcription factor Trihelix family [Helianthus annuus]KAJ0589405.1 putative transcription factor Trihelix family [Helianthus annuus]KAJ0597400.1 putative transcription factor Trihelix family [Helianthus annuus]KAJ0758062.1 putative transcription factor Trihelix family [Helianthus annuus]
MDNNNNNNNKPIKQENHKDHHDQYSPKKLPTVPATGSNVGADRMKRDEWSEGAVSSLLEAYEAKWTLRNRAKLKGHDWEDVAKHVSSRANSSKSPKTQTQCKNKIESMKKRYRSESATADVSSWPLFHRLDLLLRGSGGGAAAPVRTAVPVTSGGDPASSSVPVSSNLNMIVFDQTPVTISPPTTTTMMIHSAAVPVSVSMPVPVPVPVSSPVQHGIEQNSIDSNGVDPENKEEVVVTKMPVNQLSEKMEIETDCSTPALYSNDKEKEKIETKNHKTRVRESRKRRRKGDNWDVAESIRWLAKVMMRSEQAKVETMREVEKMRADAEVKRGELDLKRTEIIAHTQLEIAKLFATCLGKAVDPSLRIGRN